MLMLFCMRAADAFFADMPARLRVVATPARHALFARLRDPRAALAILTPAAVSPQALAIAAAIPRHARCGGRVKCVRRQLADVVTIRS